MDGIIVAITAGTFLYVGATEVVGEEFDNVQGTFCILNYPYLHLNKEVQL